MMKKLLGFLLALTLLPMAALADDADDDNDDPATLSVQGSATVTLAADMAQVTLGVVTTAETVEAASAANAQTIADVIAALTAQGMEPGSIVTDNFSVTAQYDYQYGKIGEAQVANGYQVTNMLRVTVDAVDTLGAAIDAAMKAGANECYGVTFLASGSAAASDQALTLAVQEGARKAALLAQATGKKLGRLIRVTEDSSAYPGATLAADTLKATGTTILSGGLSFAASVTMVYEAE